jgi:hypothetical protein
MKTALDRKSISLLAIALTLVAMTPSAFAANNPSSGLDKHSRKIEKKLSKFQPGSYVQIELRDSSERLGALNALSDSTFEIANADNNKLETYSYSDVSEVRKGKEYIGEGSESHHRPRFLVPVIITAAAAGAAFAIVESVH